MNESLAASGTGRGRNRVSMQFEKSRVSSAQRWISAVELAVGCEIVIGHNVYRVIPNEIPILFVLAPVSFWLRDGPALARLVAANRLVRVRSGWG